MALILCGECGKGISDTVKKCPHCGIKIRKVKKLNIGHLGTVIIAIALIVIGVNSIYKAVTNDKQGLQTEAMPPSELINITLEKFNEIKIGMTYEEVCVIIGVDGELFSETVTEHFGTYAVYLWKSEDTIFEGIECHFDNGKLSSKTQIGLE